MDDVAYRHVLFDAVNGGVGVHPQAVFKARRDI